MAQNREQGFTLIEAAVAIAVVAILSGIIVPLVVKNINDAQVARARNEVQVIAAALAAQIRDTGTRPTLNGGVMGTGVGNALWASGQGTIATGLAVGGSQTFNQLFAGYATPAAGAAPAVLTAAQRNAPWGAAAMVGTEFSWKGPYLSFDVTNKSTPWGGRYYIFGYNITGRNANSAIWVVCPGADNNIDTTTNPIADAASATFPQAWRLGTGASMDDIAVRVN